MKRLITNLEKKWPSAAMEWNEIINSSNLQKLYPYYSNQFRDHQNSGDDFIGKTNSSIIQIITDSEDRLQVKELFNYEAEFNRQLRIIGSRISNIELNGTHLEKYNTWLNLILQKKFTQINQHDIIPRIILRCHRNFYEDCWINDIPKKQERLRVDMFDRYLSAKFFYTKNSDEEKTDEEKMEDLD